MYILDYVKYLLNQDLDLLKQSPLDEYDEGRFNTIQDLIDVIRAQEACFNEEKFLKKHGFKEPKEAQETMVMEKDNLYLNSAFAEWLKQCPANVDHNYNETNVDLYGTRVQICFSIED